MFWQKVKQIEAQSDNIFAMILIEKYNEQVKNGEQYNAIII